MAKGYKTLHEDYLKQSEEFTELNKAYNRAVHAEALTDDLELKFLKAERALQVAYRAQQDAKIEEAEVG